MPSGPKRKAPLVGNQSPVPKRSRFDGGETSADVVSDLESLDVELVSKKDDFFVDEEGSFFFATQIAQDTASNASDDRDPNIPATSLGTAANRGCVKFVQFLPSEIASMSIPGDGDESDLASNSANAEPQVTSAVALGKRVTRSTTKDHRATQAAQEAKATAKARPKAKSGKKTKPPAKPKVKTMAQSQPKQTGRGSSSTKSSTANPFPRLTLKVKRPQAPEPKTEPEVEALPSEGEEERPVTDEEVDELEEDPAPTAQKLVINELKFAVQVDGANKILQLPFNVDYDLFRVKVADILVIPTPEMRLSYKMPGTKKGDLGQHLRSREQFDGLVKAARKIIDTQMAAIGEIKGNSQRAVEKRAKDTLKVESFCVEIQDLSKGKGNGAASKGADDTKSFPGQPVAIEPKKSYYRQIIENRKCNTCGVSRAVITVPGKGSVHMPVNREGLGLWVSLACQRPSCAFDTDPPSQVRELLLTDYYKRSSQRESTSNSSKQATNEPEGTQPGSLALVPSSQTVGGGIQGFQSIPAHSLTAGNSNTFGALLSPSLPFSLGNSLPAANMAMLSNSPVTLSPATLSSLFSNQLSQFTANASQPQVILYGLPSGLGLPTQNMFMGVPNFPFTSIARVSAGQMNELPANHSGTNEGNAQGD